MTTRSLHATPATLPRLLERVITERGSDGDALATPASPATRR